MALGGSLAGMARVVLQVDDSQFHRDFRRDQQTFRHGTDQMGRDAQRMGRGVLAGSGAFRSLGRSIAFASASFLGAAGFAAVVKNSIGLASNLHEQLNKTDVVFKENAGSVKAWSKTTADSFGIARDESLAFASTFGNLLVPMGFAREAASKMSVSLVELSADLASFNNASPEDTLLALRSGLVGQARPLRQFGIFLSEDRVKAEALADGIAKTSKSITEVSQANTRLAIAEAKLRSVRKDYGPGTTQYAAALLAVQKAQEGVTKAVGGHTVKLTDAEKAQARYNIIFKDSKDAQGDFARTSGGLANQQRILAAQLKEVQERIGTALMPTILNITKAVTAWLGNTKNMESVQRTLNHTIDTAGTIFSTLKDILSPLARGLKRVVDLMGGVKDATVIMLAAFAISKVSRFTGALVTGWVNAGRSAQYNSKLAQGESRAMARTYATSMGSMRAATIGLALTIKGALISTGIGALIVAFGLAAEYVITHWSQVSKWFQLFWIRLQVGALRAYKHMVEPFSHLPGTLGDWARKAKWSVEEQLKQLGDDAAELSKSAGERAGEAFLTGYNAAIEKQGGITLIQGGKLVPQDTPGGIVGTGKGRGGKIAGRAIGYARQPGASGANFSIPGGDRPGALKQDCSSFTQAVYRQSGLSIGGNTTSQWSGAPIKSRSRAGIQPGDLIFFYYHNGTSPPPDHVGIYIGQGQLVEDHGQSRGVTTGGVNWGGFFGWARYAKGGDTAPKSPVDTATEPVDVTPTLTTGTKGTKAKKAPKALPPLVAHKPGRIFKAPFTAIQGIFEAAQSGTRLVTRSSPFGRIKVSIPTDQPQDIAGWKKLQNQIVAAAKLIRVRLRKLQKTIRGLRRAIRRAERSKHRQGLRKLRQHLLDAQAKASELLDELSALKEDYIVCAEAIAALKGDERTTAPDLPPELDLKAAQAEATEDTADDLAVLKEEEAFYVAELAKPGTAARKAEITRRLAAIRQQMTDLIAAGVSAREAGLVELPPAIQLAMAQAALTPDTADDLQALQAAQAYYQTALQTPNLSTATRIALINSLASVLEQIKSATGQQAAVAGDSALGFLAGLRGLREFQSNVYNPLDFLNPSAQTGVTVVNNYRTMPEDPHLYSAALAFDLGALT